MNTDDLVSKLRESAQNNDCEACGDAADKLTEETTRLTRPTLGDSGKEYCNHCAGDALVDPSVNNQLESMRKDAARYELIRENIGRLTVHTARNAAIHAVTLIEINPDLNSMDPQTVDQAMDTLLAAEEAREEAAEQARREA